MATSRPLRTTALRLLIVSVALSTVLGAVALIVGSGEEMQKVLVTALCGSGASVFAFIGASGLERRGMAWCAVLAAAASVLGFGLLAVGTWTEPRSRSMGFAQDATTCVVIGATAGYVVLLSRARLRPEHRWAAYVTYGLALLLAALILASVWARRLSPSSERFMGVVAVLLAGASLLVPILARMAQAQGETAAEGLGARPRYCPACGHGLEQEDEPQTCGACGRSFRVTFEGEAASPFQ